jgi:hypothetical protein
MDCSNLNFLALPDEVRKHAEKALKSFSGSGMLVFNQQIFDAIGKLREENQLFEMRLDEQENDVYLPVDEDYWMSLLKNEYFPAFARGYKEAKETIISLKVDVAQQHFTAFSGVYRVDENFTHPISELDGHQVVLDSKMNSFGYQTGQFIGFWDFIFLNPQPFEALFQVKSKSKPSSRRSGVEFHISKMNAIELVNSIIAIGDVTGTKKDIFATFSDFFGVELNHIYKYGGDVDKRNAGNETKYVDALKSAHLRVLQK